MQLEQRAYVPVCSSPAAATVALGSESQSSPSTVVSLPDLESGMSISYKAHKPTEKRGKAGRDSLQIKGGKQHRIKCKLKLKNMQRVD